MSLLLSKVQGQCHAKLDHQIKMLGECHATRALWDISDVEDDGATHFGCQVE